MANGFLSGIETGKGLAQKNPFDIMLDALKQSDERKSERDKADLEFREKLYLEGIKHELNKQMETFKAKKESEAATVKAEREKVEKRKKRMGELLKTKQKGKEDIRLEQEKRKGEKQKAKYDIMKSLQTQRVKGTETRKTERVKAELKDPTFKPFQLNPEREQEFKVSTQNGLNALQEGVVNPATGQPYTAQEIFRMIAAEFPGQASKLRTIFLSGVRAGETEDFKNILFGE